MGFELLTASSGAIHAQPVRPAASAPKAISVEQGEAVRVVSGKEQLEMKAITEYLAECKRRLLKEHREEQEAEWRANKERIGSYLEKFRAKKRQLSATGMVNVHRERRVLAKTESSTRASSPPSSSSSSSSSPPPSSGPAGRHTKRMWDIPTEAAYFHSGALHVHANCPGAVEGAADNAVDNASLLAISGDGRSAAMQEDGELTAVLEGVAAPHACARISFVLGRDNSGDVDFGVVAPDGSHGLFYLGRTGEIAAVDSVGANGFNWSWRLATKVGNLPPLSPQTAFRVPLASLAVTCARLTHAAACSHSCTRSRRAMARLSWDASALAG